MLEAIHSGSRGTLEIRTLQSIGPHYAKTLRLWGEKFEANWESEIKPMLLQGKKDDEGKRKGAETEVEKNKRWDLEMGAFKRKWEVT